MSRRPGAGPPVRLTLRCRRPRSNPATLAAQLGLTEGAEACGEGIRGGRLHRVGPEGYTPAGDRRNRRARGGWPRRQSVTCLPGNQCPPSRSYGSVSASPPTPSASSSSARPATGIPTGSTPPRSYYQPPHPPHPRRRSSTSSTREPRRVFSHREPVLPPALLGARARAARRAARAAQRRPAAAHRAPASPRPTPCCPTPRPSCATTSSGQEWLREQGMTVEPRLAYLPDDFGHSPALPSLLRALGFDQAGDHAHRRHVLRRLPTTGRKRGFPLPGSSAELLEREQRTLDFVWRAPDGAEVLCHWNAFTYFQGDMLAHLGVIRWMGIVFGAALAHRAPRGAAHRRASSAELGAARAHARTCFCPIGCDFNGPIPGLVELLDRYNERRYPTTGVLCRQRRPRRLPGPGRLPPRPPAGRWSSTPTRTGWASTPAGPRSSARCNRIARKLIAAEKLLGRSAPPPRPRERAARRGLQPPGTCSSSATTTTSSPAPRPTASSRAEQRPLAARRRRRSPTSALGACAAAPPTALAGARAAALAPRRRAASRSRRRTTGWRSTSEAGGCLVSLADAGGEELLAGPANDLVAYHDTRRPLAAWATSSAAAPSARSRGRATGPPTHHARRSATGCSRCASTPSSRAAASPAGCGCAATRPILQLRARRARPRRRRTITCRFPTLLAPRTAHAWTSPAASCERPARKLYDPTFWPARDASPTSRRRRGRPGLARLPRRPGRRSRSTARGPGVGRAAQRARTSAPSACLAARLSPGRRAPTPTGTRSTTRSASRRRATWRTLRLPERARAALDQALGLSGAAALAALAWCDRRGGPRDRGQARAPGRRPDRAPREHGPAGGAARHRRSGATGRALRRARARPRGAARRGRRAVVPLSRAITTVRLITDAAPARL